MRIRTLSLLVCVMVSPPAWSRADAPLADRVPEGALLYVGWAGRSLTFDGSRLGQLLSDPDLKRAVGAIDDAVVRHLAGQESQQTVFKHLWAMGKIAWQHPAAVGLFDVVRPAFEGARRREPVPTGAVLIDLGKDKAAFEGELQGLLAAAGEQVKILRATVGDVSYHRFGTPAGPCGLGFVNNVFFLCVGDKTPETVVSLVRGRGRSLGADAGFQAAMKEVSGEAVQLAWYVNVSRAYAVVEKLAGPPPGAAAGEEHPFRKVLKALGADGITALAGADSIVDRGIHERTRIFCPAPHRGVLLPLAGGALPPDALAGVPGDADFAAAGRLDVLKVLAEIRRMIPAFDPRAPRDFSQALRDVGRILGVEDVEKEVLAHLGDVWSVYSGESLGGFLTGTVLTVTVKDPVAFAPVLAKLEARLKQMIFRPGEKGGPPTGFTVRSMKSGPVEVHYVAAVGRSDIFPVAPAWAVHKGRLYVAAFPQVVLAAALGSGEKPLSASPQFAALRKRVSASASAVVYFDGPRMLRRVYGLYLLGWTVGSNALAGEVGPLFAPDMLPLLPKLETYMRPSICAVSSDAKGITIESYGSLPGGLGMVGLNTMPVGVLMPSLARARQLAQSSMSAANLHAIGMSCMIYLQDHNGRLPPDLVALVKAELLMPRALYSPASGRKPRIDPETGLPAGPFDYVYLGGKIGDASAVPQPADTVLAHERPELSRRGQINVLYLDGHVERVPLARLRRELVEIQKLLTERKK